MLHHMENVTSLKYAKVEYHNANENPLQNSEKIACVGQRLMYPSNNQKNLTMLSFIFKCHYVFRFLH